MTSRAIALPFGSLPLPRPNLARDSFLLLGLLCGVFQATGHLPVPYDSRAYFTADLAALYPADWTQAHYEGSGYLYPPPLAQFLEPIRLLGWPIFTTIWTTLLFGAIWLMAGRWSWLVAVLGIAAILVPIARPLGVPLGYALNGNVQLLIGACCVLAFRWPHVWALPLLTKVGPGIGVLWHAFRREWRAFGLAMGTTTAIALASFIVSPALWGEFLVFALTNDLQASPLTVVPIPFALRLAMSALVLAWAAPRDQRWALPIAVGWAMPALYVDTYLAIWLAAIRLSGRA